MLQKICNLKSERMQMLHSANMSTKVFVAKYKNDIITKK